MRFRVALCASAVLAAAACTSTTSGAPAPPSRSGAIAAVTCSAVTPGVDVGADAATVRARAARFGTGSVRVSGDRIVTTITDLHSTSGLGRLCAGARLDFRPLVAPAAPQTCGSTCRSDPLSVLRGAFRLPTSGAEFAALTPDDRAQLAGALADADCSTTPSAGSGSDLVACDDQPDTGTRLVYLLGPRIVAGSEITGATADPPDRSHGSAEWTISIRLDAAAAQRWFRYTSAHNLAGQTSTVDPTTCSLTSVPCADWVGFVLGDAVLSLPVTEQAIRGPVTQISGNFTAQSAKSLAQRLRLGGLPVPLRLDSTVVSR